MHWNQFDIKVLLLIIIAWYLYRIFRSMTYLKKEIQSIYYHFKK
jgi:hypothetical protein